MRKVRAFKSVMASVLGVSMLISPFLYPEKTSADSAKTVDVVTGYYTTFVKANDANWYGTGDNSFYQLAADERTDVKHFVKSGLDDAIDISTGQNVTLVAKSDGHVLAWGQALGSYRLGIPSRSDDVKVPTVVEGISDVKKVAAGAQYSLALKNDGTVWIWGTIGTDADSYVPRKVEGLTNVTQIEAGYKTAYAITSDGSLWAWGNNSFGQIGDGDTTITRKTPVKVLSNVKKVVSTEFTTLALKNDGTAWGWGRTSHGSTGYGNAKIGGTVIENTYSAHKYGTLDDGYDAQINDIVDIALGFRASLIVRADGTVWGAGTNSSGELGLPSVTSTNPRPVKVNNLTNVSNIFMGASHALAIDSNGDTWGWGDSSKGQLGFSKTGINQQAALLNITNAPLMGPEIISSGIQQNEMKITIKNPSYVLPLILEYRLNDGEWIIINSGSSINIKENGLLEAKVTDTLGQSKTSTYQVKGLNVKPSKPLLESQFTNNEMNVKFSSPKSADTLKLEYRFKGGAWNTVTSGSTIAFKDNGLIEARVTNESNLSSDVAELAINSIDTSIPGSPTFTVNNDSDCDGSVVIIINYPSDATIKEYKNSTDSTWTTYTTTGGLYYTSDRIIEARAKNKFGVTSPVSTYAIDYLQKEKNNSIGYNKVYVAEVMKDQANLDEARAVVKGLIPLDEHYRIDFERRLDALQDLINQKDPAYQQKVQLATEAVIKAEKSLVQADLDAARLLVNPLKGNDKINLTTRLDAVQTLIDAEVVYVKQLKEATDAVVKAEGSKLQVDVNAARTLVQSLRIVDKSSLSVRLDIIQNYIDEETSYIRQLNQAVIAVEKAEGTKLQIDVNAARSLVAGLRDTDQTALTARLDIVQSDIDASEGGYTKQVEEAIAAVVTAETSKTQQYVDSAKTLVQALRASDQTALMNRLNAVQNWIDSEALYIEQLSKATEAVVKAETSKTQTDVNAARNLVKALRESDKSLLNGRLDLEQVLIDSDSNYTKQVEAATTAVVKAESTKSQTDLDTARDLVSKLKDKDQESLNDRLDALQDILNDAYDQKLKDATAAVEKAEKSLSQSDVTVARALIKDLNTYDKALLGSRLDVVQDLIDSNQNYQDRLDAAILAVKKAETSVNQDDLDDARELVNILNPDDQTDLHLRLDALQVKIDERDAYLNLLAEASNSVRIAELSRDQADVDAARTQVAQLKNEDQQKLNLRLDSVQSIIDLNRNLQPAKEAVFHAETTQTQVDVDKAKELVEKLREGAWKTYLLDILNELQSTITDVGKSVSQFDAAKTKLSDAELSKKQADLTKAKSAIDALPASNLKNELTERFTKVQAEVNLTKAVQNASLAVTRATSAKTLESYNAAIALVNPLPESSKSDLVTKLETLKLKIDSARSEETEVLNAETLVEFAESSLLENDYEQAALAVSQLKTSSSKTKLNKRITVLKNGLIKENLVLTKFEVTAQTKNTNTLTWTKVDGATGYKLERMLNGVVIKTFTLTTQKSYKDVGLELNTEYTYRLTPKAGSILGEAKQIIAPKFTVELPAAPSLVEAFVDEDGILHVTGTGQGTNPLYFVVQNEKGIQQTRAGIIDGEEKAYIFNTAGVYTVKIEAYNTSSKVSSYSETKSVTVTASMVEPPTAEDAIYSVKTEGEYIVFNASVANNVDGAAQKFTFEIRDPDDKRINYGTGKLVEDRIVYTFKRNVSTAGPGTYTLIIKGKRGSTFGTPATFELQVQ